MTKNLPSVFGPLICLRTKLLSLDMRHKKVKNDICIKSDSSNVTFVMHGRYLESGVRDNIACRRLISSWLPISQLTFHNYI